MTVRNIKKSLAGVEDIATGLGALQQERGVVHRVNVFPSSYSYIDMQQYEGGDFFRLYGSDLSYTDYRRNPAGAIGIPAGVGGVWEPLTSNDKTVGGNTVDGAYLVDDTYLVWHAASSRNYAWSGSFPRTVVPGTDPTLPGSGYVQQAGVTLRDELVNNGPLSVRFEKISLRDVVSVSDNNAVDVTGATDSSAAIQALVDSGVRGLFVPAGVNILITEEVVLPAKSFVLCGMGEGSTITCRGNGCIRYNSAFAESGFIENTWIRTRIHGITFIVETGATAVKAFSTWNAVAKPAHFIDHCHFIVRAGASTVNSKCIHAQGIWALHVEGNTACYTGNENSRFGQTGYFLYLEPGATLSTAIMNVHVANNQTAYISYCVYGAARVVQAGGRCEGIQITNNNFLIGTCAVDMWQTTSVNTSMNQISDFTQGVIYRGCFLSNINDNTEIFTSGECIILMSIAASLNTANNVEGNICGNTGSTAGTSIPCILVDNPSNAGTNAINIGGNLLQGPAGTTYGTGIKFTGAYAFSYINVFANQFKYIKFGIDLAMTGAGAVASANLINAKCNSYPANVVANISNRAYLYRVDCYNYPINQSVTFSAAGTIATSFQVTVSKAQFDSPPLYGTLTGVMADGKIAIGVVNPTSGSNTTTNAYVTWNVIGAATIPAGTFTASGFIAGYSKIMD